MQGHPLGRAYHIKHNVERFFPNTKNRPQNRERLPGAAKYGKLRERIRADMTSNLFGEEPHPFLVRFLHLLPERLARGAAGRVLEIRVVTVERGRILGQLFDEVVIEILEHSAYRPEGFFSPGVVTVRLFSV